MTCPLLQLKLKNPTGSLRGYSTCSNRFRIFYRSPIPSKNNAMINTRCHISFILETNFGFSYRKNALQVPIKSFTHSILDITPSPRLWVTMILSSTFPFPWPAPSVQRGSPLTIFPTIIGHLIDSRSIETNKSQP
jgi:hypothetical protein